MPVKYTEADKQLLRNTCDRDVAVADASFKKVATALELPVREGQQPGDIHSDLFEAVDAVGRTSMEYPVHYMEPGTEDDYVGFTVPTYGSLPIKLVQGTYVNIPVNDIAGVIDWDNRYARDARWDVLTDAVQNVRNQLVAKKNDMAWHTIVNSGFSRGIIATDSDALQGQFTPKLVSVLKSTIRRNGGGNSTSINTKRLTDLYVSVEAMEDMRDWKVDLVDEVTRREIWIAEDGSVSRIFNTYIHDIDELGEGQKYQLFYSSVLGGSMPTTAGHTDTEIVVAISKNSQRSFVMPVGQEFELDREERKRHRQTGLIGTESVGFAVLDSRDVLLGSF